MTEPNSTEPDVGAGGPWLALLDRQRWLVFTLPLAVYLLSGSLEPTPDTPGGGALGLSIAYDHYPLVYAIKLALTALAIVAVAPGYRALPLRMGGLSVVVGVVGVFVWVGLCWLGLEQTYLAPVLRPLGLAGERSAFNPLDQLANSPAWAWGFLTLRFFGLVVIVPLVEEMFYRGFLMRFPVKADWWDVPLGETNAMGLVLAVLLPAVSHPGELVAAVVWFGMIAWLYMKTKSLWQCVVAHAVTNLLLGLYVVTTGHWELM